VSTYYACAAPTAVQTPRYVASDGTALTITVEWERPIDNGGCAVLGYRLYRTAGLTDPNGLADFFDQTEPSIQVTSLSDSDPSATQHTVALSGTGTLGELYKIKVEAYNQAGATSSSSLAVVLASLPSQPPQIPSSDASVTSPEALGLVIGLLDSTESPPANGGSPIL
jgi:hypothetical protein